MGLFSRKEAPVDPLMPIRHGQYVLGLPITGDVIADIRRIHGIMVRGTRVTVRMPAGEEDFIIECQSEGQAQTLRENIAHKLAVTTDSYSGGGY